MLDHKVCLVTGASRGIGKAIAIQLGCAGAQVIGTATSAQGAGSITEYLNSQGIGGMGLALDVRSQNSIDECIAQIAEKYGAVEILVNNAGITRDSLLMRMKPEQWQEVYETNLRSVFLLSKACLRAMMKSKFGRIISISSVVGAIGNPGQANYASSKAGIHGFTKALAHEVASRGITVNCVAPGLIQTDMTDQLSAEQKKYIIENIPMGRLGQADEIGKAVKFLASNESAYITGQTLHVNGGLYMQ